MTIDARIDPDAPFTDYRIRDLLFPAGVLIDVVGEPDLTVDVFLRAAFDRELLRYVTASVEVRQRDGGPEVTGAELRSIRVQQYLREGLLGAIEVGYGPDNLMPLQVTEEKRAEIKLEGPSSKETLRWVGMIYRAAEAVSMRPAKAVQDQLGLTQATASVWIRRARDTGMMVGHEF